MVIIKPNGISICLFSHLELNQHQQFNQHTTLCHLFTTDDLFCIAQFGTVYRRIVLIYNAIGPLFLPTAVHIGPYMQTYPTVLLVHRSM